MISTQEKDRLKVHLKNDYVGDVLKTLAAKKILSRNNEPYSEVMIRAVFNGYTNNMEIEAAILKVFNQRKKAENKLQKLKATILSA